ncbi:hypothetical protein RFI_07167, partial [Reticulomyxa filosa]
ITLTRDNDNGVEYYLFNPNLNGPFHVFYDDASLQLIKDSFIFLSPLNQLFVLADRFALMFAGYVNAQTYLQLLYDVLPQIHIKMKHDEISFAFWRDIINSLITIDSIFCEYGSPTLYSFQLEVLLGNEGSELVDVDKQILQSFRAFCRDLLVPVWEMIGQWSVSSNDTDDIKSLRPYLASALVWFNDTAVIEQGSSLLLASDGSFDLSAIDRDMVVPVLEAALAYTTTATSTLQWFFENYSNWSNAIQASALRAIGSTYWNESSLEKIVKWIMTDEVDDSEKIYALYSCRRCNGRDMVWKIIYEDNNGKYWNYLQTLYQNGFLVSDFIQLPNSFASYRMYNQIFSFYSPYSQTTPANQRPVNQTLELIGVNANWLSSNRYAVNSFLVQNGYIVSSVNGNDGSNGSHSSKAMLAVIISVTISLAVVVVILVILLRYWKYKRDVHRYKRHTSEEHNLSDLSLSDKNPKKRLDKLEEDGSDEDDAL